METPLENGTNAVVYAHIYLKTSSVSKEISSIPKQAMMISWVNCYITVLLSEIIAKYVWKYPRGELWRVLRGLFLWKEWGQSYNLLSR